MAMTMRGQVIIALVTAAGCGFATRSGDFECDQQEDCPDDRSCQSGWCVSGGGGLADGNDQPEIECDEGVPCVIDCPSPGSCGGGIDCSEASSCTVTCSGDASCSGAIECGDGPCDIQCTGLGSCTGTIDCDDACSCDLDCSGPASCSNTVDCPFTGQCKDGKECDSSGGAVCDAC
jgi:hypothetical protein